MSKFQIGDHVAVLDDTIEGIVFAVNSDQIHIKTNDDFNMTFFVNELVKIHKSNIIDSVNSSSIFNNKNEDVILDKKKNIFASKKKKKEIPAVVIDLHIEKLVKNSNHLSNFDILTKQIDTAKYHLELARSNRIPKLVLIHGVGEGVLKTELEFLVKKYDSFRFQEADFQKYGWGAMEINLIQKNLI